MREVLVLSINNYDFFKTTSSEVWTENTEIAN